jgi:GTP-binding protein
MSFIDEAKIYVKAGDGGSGVAAFRRESKVPRGGPSGGDGGNGGDVIFVADSGLHTLLDFRYQQHYRAKSGERGGNKDMYGAAGPPLVVKVPLGTVVVDEHSGEQIADFTENGQRVVIAKGGMGGRGNIHFKTPWNRTPQQFQTGTPGQERTVRLKLKLLADCGLVGFPNAGKSTFISSVSRARPKIGDYPFTTLTPHLGMVELPGANFDRRSFVIADIPGLIEGAAEGAGLGHRFLRHVERTRVLLHLIEIAPDPGREPIGDFDTLNRELEKYDAELAERPQIVCLTKLDVPETREAYPELERRFAERGHKLHAISAVTREGVPALLEVLWRVVKGEPVPKPESRTTAKAAPPRNKTEAKLPAKPATKPAMKPAAKRAARPAAKVPAKAAAKPTRAVPAKKAKTTRSAKPLPKAKANPLAKKPRIKATKPRGQAPAARASKPDRRAP